VNSENFWKLEKSMSPDYLVKTRFPKASKSFLEANPQLSNPIPEPTAQKIKRGKMNKTEAEFAFLLEMEKKRDEILRYEFEGITLRWADMKYTPDFVVFVERCHVVKNTAWEIKLIEVKGGHIWDRDIVRFKGARAYWPEFQFEMHQKTKDGWKRIH